MPLSLQLYESVFYVVVDGRLQCEECRVEITHAVNERVRVRVTSVVPQGGFEFDPTREGAKEREHVVTVHFGTRGGVPFQKFDAEEVSARSTGSFALPRAKIVSWQVLSGNSREELSKVREAHVEFTFEEVDGKVYFSTDFVARLLKIAAEMGAALGDVLRVAEEVRLKNPTLLERQVLDVVRKITP